MAVVCAGGGSVDDAADAVNESGGHPTTPILELFECLNES